ncbi:unnamed protein product [Acanthosepion pharaonis]|uniref:Uncharacterized protein n=1 Tax=Acanthosepion pharaonis TaxID=158019 RepID=A0A812B5T0_ACAPH|nr:unnamed protein product [Sepia pharaonis]
MLTWSNAIEYLGHGLLFAYLQPSVNDIILSHPPPHNLMGSLTSSPPSASSSQLGSLQANAPVYFIFFSFFLIFLFYPFSFSLWLSFLFQLTFPLISFSVYFPSLFLFGFLFFLNSVIHSLFKTLLYPPFSLSLFYSLFLSLSLFFSLYFSNFVSLVIIPYHLSFIFLHLASIFSFYSFFLKIFFLTAFSLSNVFLIPTCSFLSFSPNLLSSLSLSLSTSEKSLSSHCPLCQAKHQPTYYIHK